MRFPALALAAGMLAAGQAAAQGGGAPAEEAPLLRLELPGPLGQGAGVPGTYGKRFELKAAYRF